MARKKEWDTDITVSFACRCLYKVEAIFNNFETKSVKCEECGMWHTVCVQKESDTMGDGPRDARRRRRE